MSNICYLMSLSMASCIAAACCAKNPRTVKTHRQITSFSLDFRTFSLYTTFTMFTDAHCTATTIEYTTRVRHDPRPIGITHGVRHSGAEFLSVSSSIRKDDYYWQTLDWSRAHADATWALTHFSCHHEDAGCGIDWDIKDEIEYSGPIKASQTLAFFPLMDVKATQIALSQSKALPAPVRLGMEDAELPLCIENDLLAMVDKYKGARVLMPVRRQAAVSSA